MIRALRLCAAAALVAVAALSPEPASAQQSLTCNSRNNERTVCNADTRGGVRLSIQHSDAPCVRGRSWGVLRNGVWVSRGCRAQFLVGDTRRNDRYDDRRDRRRDDRYDRRDRRANLSSGQAVALCRNEIRRSQGVRNRDIRLSSTRQFRDGDYRLEWSTRDRSGTCTVDARSRRVNLRYDRRNRW